jgi:hypothetical protein
MPHPLLGQTTPTEILDRCEAQYGNISSIQYAAAWNTSDNHSNSQTVSSKIIFDRLGAVSYFCSDIFGEGKKEFIRKEAYFKEGKLLDMIYDSTGGMQLNIWSKETLGRNASDKKASWESVFTNAFLLAPLGMFQYSREFVSIFDLLRDVPRDALKLRIDKGNAHIIEGESKQHKISICILPDKKFVISSFSIDVLQPYPDVFLLERLEYISLDIKKWGDFYFPEKFSFAAQSEVVQNTQPPKASVSVVGEKKKHYTSSLTANIDKLSINKKIRPEAIAFQTKIPNGTRVLVKEVPQIHYIWMDGKIEPRTDELMLRIAQGDHKFIPGTDEPRFWFMALGAILIIVGFTLKGIALYKQWHSGDNKEGKTTRNTPLDNP